MKNFSYSKSDVIVTPVVNGYLVKSTQPPCSQYCYKTFEETVNCLARELGLLAVGETLRLESSSEERPNG